MQVQEEAGGVLLGRCARRARRSPSRQGRRRSLSRVSDANPRSRPSPDTNHGWATTADGVESVQLKLLGKGRHRGRDRRRDLAVEVRSRQREETPAPCPIGSRPVSTEATAGTVQGAGDWVRSSRTARWTQRARGSSSCVIEAAWNASKRTASKQISTRLRTPGWFPGLPGLQPSQSQVETRASSTGCQRARPGVRTSPRRSSPLLMPARDSIKADRAAGTPAWTRSPRSTTNGTAHREPRAQSFTVLGSG